MSAGNAIRRLAIVNRGEAAIRCIRSVKALRALENSDLESLAIYTDVDRDAPFVRHADHAIWLEAPDGAVAAYLDHDRLIALLVRAVATQYRLSPRARKDLADRMAAVLNSVGDQILPADGGAR